MIILILSNIILKEILTAMEITYLAIILKSYSTISTAETFMNDIFVKIALNIQNYPGY